MAGEAMIKDGLFDQFAMQTVWGMHNWPGMEVGKVGVHDGAMAAADMFEIHLTGVGGHAAVPDLTVDPIPCGAAIVQSLQSIVARLVAALGPAVVSVTIFESGSALNVIPGTARRLAARHDPFRRSYVAFWKMQSAILPHRPRRPMAAK